MASSARQIEVEKAFRNWASEYDQQPNPVTALEGRVLAAVLPKLSGMTVVDLGCGTGRNFKYFREQGAGSVIGVDLSPEMLRIASEHASPHTQLFRADACDTRLPKGSVDLIVASLLIGYVDDLRAFSFELRRLCKDGGRVFLSDIHPNSIRRFGWKRVATGSGAAELPTIIHGLDEITTVLERSGFSLEMQLEIPFGLREEAIFERAGKGSVVQTVAGEPAIFMLQVRAEATPKRSASISICDGIIALDATTTVTASLATVGNHVRSVGVATVADRSIDAEGWLLLPGLVNAHDHLEFGLFPRLGRTLYESSADWAKDIHVAFADTISRHRGLNRSTRILWGGLRNALCGVTTVCHHNALDPVMQKDDFPVTVLQRFSWAHSLPFDEQCEKRFQQSNNSEPFVLHAAEGYSSECEAEFDELERLGMLGDRTVLVHGIGCSVSQLERLASQGGSLVWCPSSNYFLFGATHAAEIISRYPKVALGSDSPLTSEGDLLDEVRFAHDIVGIEPRSLYSQVTTSASNVLRLTDDQGRIRPGGVADFFAVKHRNLEPAERIVNLSYRDVELVVGRGVVRVASPEAYERLPHSERDGLFPLEVGGELRWVRHSLGTLFETTHSALGCSIQMTGREVRHAAIQWL